MCRQPLWEASQNDMMTPVIQHCAQPETAPTIITASNLKKKGAGRCPPLTRAHPRTPPVQAGKARVRTGSGRVAFRQARSHGHATVPLPQALTAAALTLSRLCTWLIGQARAPTRTPAVVRRSNQRASPALCVRVRQQSCMPWRAPAPMTKDRVDVSTGRPTPKVGLTRALRACPPG
jgi:hypothetical protein